MASPAASPVLILDTSVVLKWFLEKDEPDVARARKLREAFLDRRCALAAPSLLLLEVANALAIGHRSASTQVAKAIEDILEIGVALVELRFPTLVKAVELASNYGVTVYDSYFLAVTMESDGLLVTADEFFLRKIGPHVNITSLRNLLLLDLM
jgi:predicted nucleic acid-binding protein